MGVLKIAVDGGVRVKVKYTANCGVAQETGAILETEVLDISAPYRGVSSLQASIAGLSTATSSYSR